MHAAALRVDLRLPLSRSLKAKRRIILPMVDHLRRRYGASVAQIEHQDTWHRVVLAVGMVASGADLLEDQLDAVRKYVDELPNVDVIDVRVSYLEEPL